MQNLPSAETYQKEVHFMPWGILIAEIIEYVTKKAPKNGTVLDLLCGTGYLIGELKKIRPDIHFTGVDLEEEFINYANKTYPNTEFINADALNWTGKQQYDVVLSTGGLHHLPFDKQKKFIEKIANLIKSDGFAIVADPYIDSYSNETERKVAAAKLGYEYLIATIKNGAPNDVVEATASLIHNDVLLIEYKNSIQTMEPYFKEAFRNVDKHKTWPKDQTEYGDYYFILRNR